VPRLIHNARFVLAGMPDAEASAERLRDEFGANARRQGPYQFARRDIAANDDGVTLAFLLHEELAAGVSTASEAMSQPRVEAALAWLIELLERCPTWREAHEQARVSGEMRANAGGRASYRLG
jgi:hypothetical protein